MVRKYLESGQEVEVIQELSDGKFLVASVVEYGWEGDEYVSDEPVVIGRVFDEPPAEKYHEKIGRLRAECEAMHDRKRDIVQGLKEAEAKYEERMEKYAKYAGLEHLDDFIDGKITHYVVDAEWSTPDIKTFEEMYGDFHGAGPRLLSLFGNSKGQLDWRINRYKDDSGSWRVCVPCLSYEEAVVKLAEIMHEKMAAEKTPSVRKVEICDRHGIPVPDDYRAAIKARDVATLKKNIDEARQKLAELEAKLQEENR